MANVAPVTDKAKEKAALKKAAADAFKASCKAVKDAEKALEAARAAQAPHIEALVKACGSAVRMNLDGEPTFVKFRKSGDGWITSYESLAGEML